MRTAADDPTDYASAIGIEDSLNAVRQFQSNAERVGTRMALAESVLGDVTDTLGRVRELALSAGNATQDSRSRAVIGQEMRQLKEQLVALANTRDADGRYLFGGTADAHPPFAADGDGVAYLGDQRSRSVGVAPGESLDAIEAGSELFMRLRAGDGGLRVRAAEGNAGVAVVDRAEATDPAELARGPLQLVARDGGFDLFDGDGVLVDSPDWSPGELLELPGARVRLQGQPEVGDRFTVSAAGSQSVFDSVQDLIDAVETPAGDAAGRARLGNALFDGLASVIGAHAALTDSRAAVGGRMNRLEGIQAAHEAASVQLQQTLSQLRDVDMIDGVARLQSQLASLEVSQQAYLRLQNLSLFRLMG